MHDLAVAAGHVQDLEVAADVVAIGNEAVLGRTDDAHVAEDRLLHDVGVVRAEEQAGVDLVAQGEVGEAVLTVNGSPKRATDMV